MKLSIITVNLNDKTGLEKTIKSVISQSFSDFEFIIIDGESTDGSIDIINQYKSKISYWVSEKDSGIYNAMNKGIRQAKGEYLYFLNSGDALHNENVLHHIFNDDPHAPFICGNFYMEVGGSWKQIQRTKVVIGVLPFMIYLPVFYVIRPSSYIDQISRNTDYTAKTLKLSPTGNYSFKGLHLTIFL